ncbi:MAG: response regulator [Elusimicrobia bacterium]|nr:response regulator [Elusimicrobiota bacterium]
MPRTILIVDDDPAISGPLQEGLEAAGYEATVAEDGLQAVERAGAAPPDLIILDFHMPGGGGTSAYTALRALGPTLKTPVVFLSAVPLEEVKASVDWGPATFFIAKPAGLDRIVPVIRKALGE